MAIKEEILRYSRQEKMQPLTAWFDSALDELIESRIYPDVNALEDIGHKLVKGLRQYAKTYNIDTAVIGMSGGVDSALTAALFETAGWKVIGVTMPIHQKCEETARGIEACKALGIEHHHVDLTATYDNLLNSFQSHDHLLHNDVMRKGNLRVRLRMMTLYNEASARKGLVASTDNFSELAAGFWTLHGDVGDVAPIQSLIKSWEVPKLAELYGVPESTVFATPTDGLGISASDEAQFGFSYLEFDILLMKACQSGIEFSVRQQLLEYLDVPGTDVSKVNKVLDRIKFSSFKRQNPYNLVHPLQPIRYKVLKELDQSLWNQA